MDAIKTGRTIRTLRRRLGLTQRQLAQQLHVSEQAVSKWERGVGAPDVSVLPELARALQADTEALLRGELEEKDRSSGDLRRMHYFVCPVCGNLILSAEEAAVSCCGKRCAPLAVQRPDAEHDLEATLADGEWYLTARHEMTREHHITFVALCTGDTLMLKRQYPEWGLETHLPGIKHGMLLWHCSRHGLFGRRV